MSNQSVVIVHPHETESLTAAIARALDAPVFDARQIATLNELLSRDPYLADQINATHATLTRIIESLVAHLDAERTARQVLTERIEALERT